ncbi:tape measure protein [Inquilinus sp.]|uniref:tape measure protein n=1 Tax=Inquilinus sp. TaxID=1932117 RepID=UPI0031E33B3B
MNARVADQVVVELRMLVDQHIRAGRRAREEFDRNIGGMASVADRSVARQAVALERGAVATERAEQRKTRAAQRAEEQRSRLVIRAQRSIAAMEAAEQRAAAAAERVAQKQADAVSRATAKAQRAQERQAQQQARAASRAAAAAERAARQEVAAAERARAAEVAARSRNLARQQAAGASARDRLMGGVSGLALGGAIGGLAVGAGAAQLATYADGWTNVANRVAAAGVPLSQVAAKQEELYQLAQRSRSPLETTADLYQRLKIATSDLGTADSDVLRLTETVVKSFKASGASTAEFQASVIQLGQALGSGVLQGDELRSIREQAPALARAIAKEFDTTVGGLKKLGEQGKLTSDRIIKALLAYSAQADKTFAKTNATFADSLTALGNGVTRYAGKLNEATGASKGFGDAIGGALTQLEDPAVIQAGVEVVTLLAQALNAAAGALAFVARNFVVLKAAGAAFIAIKLVSFIRDLVAALTTLRVAALTNPFTAILAVAASVIVILADVIGSVDSVGEAFDRLNTKINGIAGSVRRALQNAANAAAEVGSRLIPGVSEQADQLESDLKSIADEQADLERQSDELTAKLEELLPDVNSDALIAQAQGIRQEFDQGKISAQEAADKIRELTATWNAPEAPGILAKIAAIVEKLIDLDTKAIAARNSLDDVLNRPFPTTPSFGFIRFSETPSTPTAPIPGERPDPPETRRRVAAGGGGKAKQPKEPTLPKYLDELKAEVAQLALNGVALKENELRTQALAKAKEDFKNKLRSTADLTAEESARIKEAAAQLEGVPAILQIAADKLPTFSMEQQLRQLNELKGLLTDPAIVEALKAQGLSAVDATKAIDMQIAAAKDTANGTTQAIQGIGDALQSGIQGAQDFEDALLKVGIALAEMLVKAAAFGGGAGGGPLGKLFDSLSGLTGGLAGLLGGGGTSAVAGATNAANAAVALLPHRAGGGQAIPGNIYEVGETGREWFAPQVPGQVIPNSVIKAAAGGGGGGGPPIQFNISLAGANGDRAIAEISAAAVKRGLAQVPEINRQHQIRFSQS